MMDIDGLEDDEVAGFLKAIRKEERNLEEEEETFYDELPTANAWGRRDTVIAVFDGNCWCHVGNCRNGRH